MLNYDMNLRRIKIKKFAALTTPESKLSIVQSLKCNATAQAPRHNFKQLQRSSSADSSATQRSCNATATLSHFHYTTLTLTALFDQGCGVYLLSPLKKYFSAQI